MMIRSTILAVALFAGAPIAYAETLSVDDIVALSDARIGDDAIIAKIQSEGRHFDLSTDEMIALRKRGVSSAVLAAMIGNSPSNAVTELSMNSPDPKVPHPPGLYALVGRGASAHMIKIDPTTTSQMKTGGVIGYALTGGIASMSMKVSITNQTARVRTATQPIFYFFFDDSRPGANASTFLGTTFLASSPNEFNLIHLNRKGDHREAKVGKVNLGGAKVGVMDKDRIEFSYDTVRPGVFRVTPNEALEGGEYGFLYSLGGNGIGGAASSRIFDFGVDPGLPIPSPELATASNADQRPEPDQAIRSGDAAPSPSLKSGNGSSTTATRITSHVRCDTCR